MIRVRFLPVNAWRRQHTGQVGAVNNHIVLALSSLHVVNDGAVDAFEAFDKDPVDTLAYVWDHGAPFFIVPVLLDSDHLIRFDVDLGEAQLDDV